MSRFWVRSIAADACAAVGSTHRWERVCEIGSESRTLEDISSDSASLEALYSAELGLEESSEIYTVSPSDGPLYVQQGEVASNVLLCEQGFKVVGSDDATTCIIFMARHRLSGVVLCTHLDGPARCEGLGATIYNMVQLNRTGGDTEIIDVYIGGGLCNSKDSQGTLKAIYVELLKAESPCAQQSNAGSEVFTVDSYLQLLDHVHNTILLPDSEGKSRPRSTGWGFLLQPSEDARTGVFNAIAQESTPPMVAVRSMLFPINCRGPSDARGRRGAAAMSAPSMRPLMHQPVPAKAPVPDSLLGTYTTTDSASDSSTTTGSVSNASSASASGMQIQVLDFRVGMEASELPFLKQLLAVSDADLLAKTSSSPHCEPEHYVRELRLVLLAMLQKAEQEQEQEGSEENEDKLKAKGGGDTFVYRLIKGITWERIS